MLDALAAFAAQVRESPVNWALVALVLYLFQAYWKTRRQAGPSEEAKHPETVVYRRFTPRELAEHDGRSTTEVYLAVKGKVFDVSPGRSFYGPDGPYGNFAGRDASRGLAYNSFDASVLTALDKPIDELQDLTEEQKQSLDEWFSHFANKYDEIGMLVNEEKAEKS